LGNVLNLWISKNKKNEEIATIYILIPLCINKEMRKILLILGLTIQTICYGQIDNNNKIMTLNKLQGAWVEEDTSYIYDTTTFIFNNKILVQAHVGLFVDIHTSFDTMRIEISDTLLLFDKNSNMTDKNSIGSEYIIFSQKDTNKIIMECEILQLTNEEMKLKYYPIGIIKNYYKKR
jgi:hypothetical protein